MQMGSQLPILIETDRFWGSSRCHEWLNPAIDAEPGVPQRLHFPIAVGHPYFIYYSTCARMIVFWQKGTATKNAPPVLVAAKGES